MTTGAASSTHPVGCTPFLKWPGGKRWLAPALVPVLRERLAGRYFEPFAGGASIFLRLAPAHASIGDVNGELMETLAVVASEPDRVVDAVWRFTNTADCYYRVRRSHPRTAVGRAARFVYLNRTAWGGIYRLNRDGAFNVPFGDSGRTICRRNVVVEAAQVLAAATLVTGDFELNMDDAGPGDVIYADPPYVGIESDHDNSFYRYSRRVFSWDDQVRLAAAAQRAAERGAFVAVSAHSNQGVAALYEGWSVSPLARSSRVSRHHHARRTFDELVLTSQPAAIRNLLAA